MNKVKQLNILLKTFVNIKHIFLVISFSKVYFKIILYLIFIQNNYKIYVNEVVN